MPTAIWKSRLRSGTAHSNLQLAVEVRQCPLGSGARGGGPAVPTGIWTARRRRRRRRRRTALIKSNNPHLAGGEKSQTPWACLNMMGEPQDLMSFPQIFPMKKTTRTTSARMAPECRFQTCPGLLSAGDKKLL